MLMVLSTLNIILFDIELFRRAAVETLTLNQSGVVYSRTGLV